MKKLFGAELLSCQFLDPTLMHLFPFIVSEPYQQDGRS